MVALTAIPSDTRVDKAASRLLIFCFVLFDFCGGNCQNENELMMKITEQVILIKTKE